MNSASRSGEGYFVSYRDPNLKETDQVFEGVADYLEQFDADERGYDKICNRHHQRHGYASAAAV